MDRSEEQIMAGWKSRDVVVSVSTLAYNHEEYIAQCIEGVLEQRTDFAFELLVHDDASTDGTAEVIRRYQQRYPGIVKPIYQRENQHSKKIGISRTYQYSRAAGKYIAFCEGDDYWTDRNKLQMQVDFLEANPGHGMCYTRARSYRQREQKFDRRPIGLPFSGFEDLLVNGNRIPTLTVLCRSDLLDRYHREVQPVGRGWLMGDYPLWLYFSHESQVGFLPEVTAVYRVLEESLSHSADVRKGLAFMESVFEIRDFFARRYGVRCRDSRADTLASFYVGQLRSHYDKDTVGLFRQSCRAKDIRRVRNRLAYHLCRSKIIWSLLVLARKAFF